MEFLEESNRYFLEGDNNKTLAEIEFSNSDKNIIISHTFVDDSLRGQQIAEKLVDIVVEKAKRENKKIIPLCPYAAKLFSIKESKYADVWQR